MNALPVWLDALLALLLLAGAGFALIGAWALARWRDFHHRLHGPSKATTLGVGCVLAASALAFGWQGQWGGQELLIVAFLFLTAPVSAHLLVQAAARERQDAESPAAPPAEPPRGSPPESANQRR